MTKMIHKQRRKVGLRQIPADKKPYAVRGMPQTILHLTDAHAAEPAVSEEAFGTLINQPSPLSPSSYSPSFMRHRTLACS